MNENIDPWTPYTEPLWPEDKSTSTSTSMDFSKFHEVQAKKRQALEASIAHRGCCYFEFPPFSSDLVELISEEAFAEDLPANYHYERVKIGPDGDYPTVEALYTRLDEMNRDRQ